MTESTTTYRPFTGQGSPDTVRDIWDVLAVLANAIHVAEHGAGISITPAARSMFSAEAHTLRLVMARIADRADTARRNAARREGMCWDAVDRLEGGNADLAEVSERGALFWGGEAAKARLIAETARHYLDGGTRPRSRWAIEGPDTDDV